MAEYPKVLIKKKSIQTIIDYCLEDNIEFSVRQKPFSDNDLEVEVKISEIKKAVLLGMFIRENRFELEGAEAVAKPAAPVRKAATTRKSKVDENGSSDDAESDAEVTEEESGGLFK